MSQPAAIRKDSVAESSVASSYTAPDDGVAAASTAAATNNNNKYTNPAYIDALEDVHTRFILNLPDSELQSSDRIFFQLEQAWWFYEDFICDGDPNCSLPRFTSLKPFALQLFNFSPLLPDASQFPSMWQEFSNYKKKISNYGCILLSKNCSRVILCQLWNSKTQTFPAGKINQGEDGLSAAARETYEETGFDPLCIHGLTAQWKASSDSQKLVTWKMPTDADALIYQETDGKRRTSYVCCGVPDDFPFAPVARKEVSNVAWHDLDQLPSRSYAVIPFVSQLKRWIKRNYPAQYYQRYGKDGSGANKKRDKTPSDKHSKTPSRDRSHKNGSRTNSRIKVRTEDDLVEAGLANVGDVSGWSEEDMFRVNERLLGRKIEYDGNPHVFAEQGFAGEDPHAFRVVGGGFLNSAGGIASLAPAPDRSRLQPLFRSNSQEDGDEDDLQPFFSDDGATPWGDFVAEVKDKSMAPRKSTVPKRKSKPREDSLSEAPESGLVSSSEPKDADSLFFTDAEITAQSQFQKEHRGGREAHTMIKYEENMAFIKQWVNNLPRPKPKRFGELKLDADEIMAVAFASLKQTAS
jgi:mRNA-decapping enzyme subunit 2